MKRFLMSVAAVAVVLTGAGLARAAQPAARVTKIDQEHNVIVNGKVGMKLHVQVTIDNLKGQPCGILVLFSDQNGKPIPGKDGQLAVAQKIVPPYPRTTWTGSLFVPYGDIHLGKGKHDIAFPLGVLGGLPETAQLLTVSEGWFILTR